MNTERPKDKSGAWTPEQEELLAEWAEKASGYRWLHSRSEKVYRKRNYTFTIPVIILSTLTGTANFAMDSFVPEEHKQIAMACVGGVNIFAGILSTLQNFLRYAELTEGHRNSEVSWSKFSREISVELALSPKMRKPAHDFLSVCRAEYDRLIEQSPTIDDPIIMQYKRAFKDADVHHPHVCNGLHKCKVYEMSVPDKTAQIIASAGEKIRPKSVITRIHHRDQSAAKHDEHTENEKLNQRNENMRELSSLKNIGRVSGMKKTDPHKIYENHQQELKSLVAVDENAIAGPKDETAIKGPKVETAKIEHAESTSRSVIIKSNEPLVKITPIRVDGSRERNVTRTPVPSLNELDTSVSGVVQETIDEIIIKIEGVTPGVTPIEETYSEDTQSINDFLDEIK
jgi:hypothetical protein